MNNIKHARNLFVGASFVTVLAALGVGQAVLDKTATAQAASAVQAPRFEVDPMWPKPLPNHWVLGQTIGVFVDTDDHIWIVHRSSSTLDEQEKGLELQTAECCAGAPPILEFDQAGNLLRRWGGPGQGYEWPDGNHGIYIDHKGFVWIGGNGPGDSHVLKFTKDGKFVMQVGKKGVRRRTGAGAGKEEGQVAGFVGNSNDPDNFGRVAKIYVDAQANEAYLADGYLNKRVAVIDADTGKLKRYWGAYGNKPDDTPLPAYNPAGPPNQQFRNPVHCAQLSHDGLLYVCDRANDRIQVFKPDGTFVKEVFINKETLGSGSVWDITFSRDAQEKYLYVSDGENARVHILDRQSLELLTSFGEGGRQPGEFYGVHSIATDSRGNIFTTETYRGQRV